METWARALYWVSWLGLPLGVGLQLWLNPPRGLEALAYLLLGLLFLLALLQGPNRAPRFLVYPLGVYLLFEAWRSGGEGVLVGYWAPALHLLLAWAHPWRRALPLGLGWVLALALITAQGPKEAWAHMALAQPVLLALTLLLARYRELYGRARFWRDQALTDPLTGLPNRRALEMALEREMARVERGERPFSLILLDLDDFKAINDRHGHAYGDEVLKRVARYLKGHIRQGDLVARWGGEEFALLLPATGPEEALRVAERIRKGLKEAVGVTGSLGVGVYRGESPGVFFQRVDQALYRAKAWGKDRVVRLTEPGTPPLEEPL